MFLKQGVNFQEFETRLWKAVHCLGKDIFTAVLEAKDGELWEKKEAWEIVRRNDQGSVLTLLPVILVNSSLEGSDQETGKRVPHPDCVSLSEGLFPQPEQVGIFKLMSLTKEEGVGRDPASPLKVLEVFSIGGTVSLSVWIS